MEMLTAETLSMYLVKQGIIREGELLQVISLQSKVNNVFRVRINSGDLIVKQAGETMAHFADEPFNPQRTDIEHAAINYLGKIAAAHGFTECVPIVLKYDAENHTHIFVAVPEPAAPLSVHLLRGNPKEAALRKLTKFLAVTHSVTHGSAELQQQFSSTEGLMLKMKFFHFHMRDAVQEPELKTKLTALIDTMLTTRIALVHNDINPKNIIICGDTPVLIDYELASYGDPAFDLGTIFGHYYLCAILNFTRRAEYFAAIRSAWESYCAECRIPIMAKREADIVQHFAPFVWSRTFGRVPVPYLPTALRTLLGKISYAVLLRSCQSFDESFALIEEYAEELRAIPPLDIEAILREVSI